MSDTSAVRVTRVSHECNTSETRETQVQHDSHTNRKSVTRVKIFDFDKDASKNKYLQRYI